MIATDTFLSGWGEAPGRSLYAMAVESETEAYVVMRNFKHRSDFKRVRFVRKLPSVGRGDHLTIADKGIAPRYFQPNAFADRDRRRPRRSSSARRSRVRSRRRAGRRR